MIQRKREPGKMPVGLFHKWPTVTRKLSIFGTPFPLDTIKRILDKYHHLK